MKDIHELQKITLDTETIAAHIRTMSGDEIKELLSVKDSQMFNLRRGDRRPSVDGLLRLMTYHKLKLSDVIKAT